MQDPTNLSELQARVTELEIQHSFQEDLLDTLNHTVVRQQGVIERLVQEVAALRNQLNAATEPGALRTLMDERPPHY